MGKRGGGGAYEVVRTLVVVNDVAQVVAAAVVCLAHAHAVVREVDIAVVAEDCEGEIELALGRGSSNN